MRMIWKTALHYAALSLVLALASSQLTKEQKKEILSLHNRYRSQVQPEAADMLHMYWDYGLALVAENYAAQCIWGHNPDGQNHLGETLYVTTETLNLNKSMGRWFEEEKQYDYVNNTCEDDICDHYTQMVWAKTSTVGCASHFCKTIQNIDDTDAIILVCNYYPPGNVEGHHPYEAGLPCSRCPEEAINCFENTCASSESPTDRYGPDTLPTDSPRTEAVGSVGITTPSAATLLLAGLTAALLL